jgi:hypothetical protein
MDSLQVFKDSLFLLVFVSVCTYQSETKSLVHSLQDKIQLSSRKFSPVWYPELSVSALQIQLMSSKFVFKPKVDFHQNNAHTRAQWTATVKLSQRRVYLVSGLVSFLTLCVILLSTLQNSPHMINSSRLLYKKSAWSQLLWLLTLFALLEQVSAPLFAVLPLMCSKHAWWTQDKDNQMVSLELLDRCWRMKVPSLSTKVSRQTSLD